MRLGTRVLMTADTLGGVFTYAVELARVLGELGTEVVLATMGRLPSDSQRAQAARIPSLTLVESDYALEWMDDPWGDVARAGRWLLQLERRFAPSIVHLNGYAHGDLPFRAPVLMVGHSCVLSWWRAVKGEAAPARYDTYRARVRRGLGGASVVVAPTHAMLGELERLYGPLARKRVIANGCDLGVFAPREKRASIVAAGRLWDEAKNLTTLAHAARALPWPLLIAGESVRPRGAGGEDASLGNGVTLLGQLAREELAELLGEAAVYAFPALYEPFGLSVLEAAASGAALVLGDIPSLRELWDGAAIFVPPRDEGALSAAIRRLVEDETLRAALSREARLRAPRYDLWSHGLAYCELYDELASDHRAGTRRVGARPVVPEASRVP